MPRVSNGQMYAKLSRFLLYNFAHSFSMMGSVLIPFFLDWGKLTQFQVQALQSWFMLVLFICQIPTGMFADRMGKRRSLILGSLFSAVGCVIYTRMPDMWMFMLGETLFGIGCAFSSGADQAFVFDAIADTGRENQKEEDRNESVIGIVHVTHLLAILLGSLIGIEVAYHFGVTAPTLFTSISYLIAIAIAFTLHEPRIVPDKHERADIVQSTRRALVVLCSNKKLLRLTIDSTLIATTSYFVIWVYQRLLGTAGVSVSSFGYYHAFLALAQIVVALLFGSIKRSEWLSTRFLSLSAIVLAAGYAVPALWPTQLTVTMFLVAGAVGLVRREYISAQIGPLIPSNQRATVLSAISMFRQMAIFVANPIIGFGVDCSMTLTLFSLAVLSLAAVGISRKGDED